jgi:pilus assembly protein CpaE
MLSSIKLCAAGGSKPLSIAVIGPDALRRDAIASAIRECEFAAALQPERSGACSAIQEFYSYPLELDEMPRMLAQDYDVVFVDMDSDAEFALDLVAHICDGHAATVMVYSEQADRNLVIRCMRAGAREFLSVPLVRGDMAGALARVSIVAPVRREAMGASRKLFVFAGAKGGCGVTTVATSFAVSLAQDSGASTLLIDLGSPLGDAAIQLETVHRYSTANAFEDFSRLDGNFLRSLVAQHPSGLSVLASPTDFSRIKPPVEAIDKLLAVARQAFHYVVVDAGSSFDLKDSSLFEDSANPYLVTQVGISELRNANRLITQFFAAQSRRLQIVLNRFESRPPGFDADQVAKALTRQADWKIPGNDETEHRAHQAINSLALEDSPASIAIRQMARAACGLPPLQCRKKTFSLFGLGLRIPA